MKPIRLAVSLALVLIVAGGYGYSQFLYLKGPEAVADFDAKVNDSKVHLLMLILLVAAIAFGFVPDREENSP